MSCTCALYIPVEATSATLLHVRQRTGMDAFKTLHVHVAILSPMAKLSLNPARLLFIVAMVCTLAGPSGAITNSSLTITALESSVFRVNSTVRLNCTLDQPSLATGVNDITWSHNGAQITHVTTDVLDSATSQLVLDAVQFEDSGTYGCGLTDGSAQSQVEIQVGLPPAKPIDLHCVSRDFTYIHCTWTKGVDTNLETSYELQYRNFYRDYLPWTTCSMTLGCKTSIHSVSLRVVASNALQQGVKSDLLEGFEVRKETVTNPPRLVEVIAFSNLSLLVKWHPPADYKSYGAYQNHLKYNLNWAYRNATSAWVNDSKNVEVAPYHSPRADLYNLSSEITGLKPYTKYYISLMVKSTHNEFSNRSKFISQTTSEAAPQPGARVMNLTCNATSSLQLTWMPVPVEKMNGATVSYIINVTGVSDSVYAQTNVTEYTVKDLNPYEYYNVSVVARNSVGDTDPSDCRVNPLPADIDRTTTSVVAAVAVVATLVVIICVIVSLYGYHRMKKSMVRIPDIKLPSYIHTDNLYTYGNPRRLPHRERESYDELINSTLFANVNPESDSCAPCCSGTVTNGFVIDKDLSKEPILEPLENHRKHPLLSARRTNSLVNTNYSQGPMEQEALLGTDAVLPDSETEKCNPSGDYSHHYGGWKDSSMSIRSGGSYMHLRDEGTSGNPNTADGGLTPIGEDSHQRSTDRLADTWESRPGLALPDTAGGHNPEMLPPKDDRCPYTKMGAAGGDSGPESSFQEVPNPTGRDWEVNQQPGSPEDNIRNNSYCDMDRNRGCSIQGEACGQSREDGGCVAAGKGKPTNRQLDISDSHPCSADEELLEASLNDTGNYVRQGLFLSPSPSPKHPSSLSGSPRLIPSSRTLPRDTGQPSCYSTQPRCHTNTLENSNSNLPGCPPLPSRPNQTENMADRPGVSSQNEVYPYVLNTSVLSSSAEHVPVEPSQDPELPRPVCENDLGDDSDKSSSISLNSGDRLSEHAPLILNEHDTSKCSSQSDEEGEPSNIANTEPESDSSSLTGNGESCYVTVGQLLSPAPAKATSGDSKDDASGVQSQAMGTPPVVRAASLGSEKGAEMGHYISLDDIAHLPGPKAVKTMCNGVQNDVSDPRSSDEARDSGYVTHEDLARMAMPHTDKAQQKSSQVDKQSVTPNDMGGGYVTQSQIKEMFKNSKGDQGLDPKNFKN